MSPARHERRLSRTALALSLLAASPLAAQPLEQAAPPAATSPEALPAEPGATTPGEPASSALAPAPATAAPPAPLSAQQLAKDLFERGREKWQAEQYEEAVRLLTASNAQAERAATLLLLGDSLEQLGQLRSAQRTFERAEQVARAQQEPAAEQRARTRAAAVAPMIPTMEIRFSVAPPDGTLVTLNGVELPREWLNRAVPYDAGEYRLDVSAPGHAPYRAQIALSNAAARLGVQVVPVTLTAVTLPADPEPLLAAPAPLPEDAGTTSKRQLAWISGGVGAAAAVTGVVLTLVALDKKKNAADHCELNDAGDDPCSERGEDLHRQSRTLANLATFSAVTSGVALVTSFTLFVITEQSTTPTGAGITYSGTF